MMTSQMFIALLIILCHQSDGQPDSNARIFRGSDATKNEFPWYIRINTHFPSIHKAGNAKNKTQYLPFRGIAYAGVLNIKGWIICN